MTALLTARNDDVGDPVHEHPAALSATALLDGPLPLHHPSADGFPAAPERSDEVDRAYAEYKQLRAAGVEVDPDAFCARFPAYQTSLRRVVEVHRELEANPGLLDGLGVWPACGEEFFGFGLEAELGRGAFARVFLAREPAVGNRQVVVKVSLHADDEAGTLGKLRHPNVVPVHSAQSDPETGFAVVCMPFLGGTTLLPVVEALSARRAVPDRAAFLLDAARDDRWPADSAASPARALRRGTYQDGVLYLGERLASALAYVHERGILHRDLKPSNVLLCPNGEPVLIDFNLALDRTLAEHRLGGTLPYMPPELLAAMAGHRSGDPVPADPRADLYALGVILYELLARAHPFGPVPLKLKTADARDFLRDRQQTGPRPLRARNRAVDPALDRLISRCLSVAPDDRPASAVELANELRRLQGPRCRARRWAVAHIKTVMVGGALVATSGAAYYTHLANQPTPAAVRARTGEDLYRAGDYAAARDAFTASLDADKDQPAVYFARGRAYQKLGGKEFRQAAINDYLAALAGGDADGRIAACLGYCFAFGNDAPLGVKWNQRAVEAGVGNLAAIHNNLSVSQARAGQFREAEESAALALKLDPNLVAARYNLASARLKLCSHDPNEIAMPGLEEVRSLIRQGVRTRTLYWEAAMLCAAEQTRRGGDPDPALDEEGVDYVRLALTLGYPRQSLLHPPKRFSRVGAWARQVPADLPTVQAPQGLDDHIRLVDPIAD